SPIVMPSSQVPAVSLKLNKAHCPIQIPSASMANLAPSLPPFAASLSYSAWRRAKDCGMGGSPPPANSTSTSLLYCHRCSRSSLVMARKRIFCPLNIVDTVLLSYKIRDDAQPHHPCGKVCCCLTFLTIGQSP